MNKYGISPLIATVLIIGFTIALGALIILWGSGFITGLEEQATETTGKALSCSEAILSLDNLNQISPNTFTFMVENTGGVDINELVFRVSGNEGSESKKESGILVAGKKFYSISFNPVKVGTIHEVQVLPIIDINKQIVTCAPGSTTDLAIDTEEVADWESSCGNALIESWEECDGVNLNSQTCLSLGFIGGSLSCNDYCTFELEDCQEAPAGCGNEVLDSGELCDVVSGIPEFDVSVDSCDDFGFSQGTVLCNLDCSIDSSGCANAPTVTDMSIGFSHVCALMSNKEIYCWGDNTKGQLGDGTINAALLPVKSLMSPADTLKSNSEFNCASNSSGLYCWGDNYYGNLGTGSPTSRIGGADIFNEEPLISLMTSPSDFALGHYSMCASNSSGLYCWGDSSSGQLGEGSTGDLHPEPQLSFMTNPDKFTVGGKHVCASNSSGLYCWGHNSYGQLGIGYDGPYVSTPILSLMTDTVEVHAGTYHTCALDSSSDTYCWGINIYGQVGNGVIPVISRWGPSSGDEFDSPELTFMTSATSLSTHADHVCATNTSGMYCWGTNENGQWGDGTTISRSNANPFPTLNQMSSASKINAGAGSTSCAINGSGLYCWGAHNFNGGSSLVPELLTVV